MAQDNDYLPGTLGALLAWSNNFDTVLATIFASVGVTSAQSATFHTKNLAWSGLMALTTDGRTRSPANIADRDTAKQAMIDNARMLVKIIQAFPGTTNGMREQLNITVPKTPQPQGAPGTPREFKGTLRNDGTLDVAWKNSNATACVYNIYRKVDDAPGWETLGGTGMKKFTDTTIPDGTNHILYKIQAVRSTGVSDWGMLNVFFGSGGAGMRISEEAPLKAAA